MALDRAACFNVPGVFSPHRLTIRYPAAKDEEAESNSSVGQVGEKRKQPGAQFLVEELAINALELATESEVFEKLFTSELQGSEHPSLTVDSVDEKDALVELMRFCYTKSFSDEHTSDKEALFRLLILADRYSVGKAILVVATALQKNATLVDACRVLDLPSSIQDQAVMEGLASFCKNLIESEMLDLDDAYKKRKYVDLSAKGMRLALANRASRVECEHTVFVMLYKWLKGGAGRERAFPSLSKLVRYQHMTSSFLDAIQQLPETQPLEVSYPIRRALVLRGLSIVEQEAILQGRNIVSDMGTEVVYSQRPGTIFPLTSTWTLAIDEGKVRALKDSKHLLVDTRELFGYALECFLFHNTAGRQMLLTKLSTPFARCGLERNTSCTEREERDEFIRGPMFAKLVVELQGQGFATLNSVRIVQQLNSVRGAWCIGAFVNMKLGQDGVDVLAENFVQQKLNLKVSLMLP